MKIKKCSILLLLSLLLITSCSSNPFTNWKQDGSIKDIKSYIDDVCNKNSKNYIPEEYRISTWDIDGTGIVERNLSNNDLLPQDQVIEYMYKTYRSDVQSIKEAYDSYVAARAEYWKNESDLEAILNYRDKQGIFCNSAIEGLTPEQVSVYFDEAMKNGYYTTKQKLTDIGYKPMKEMYKYLQEHNFQVYFVSGSFRYALYAIASNIFGNIDFQHCIGSDFDVEYVVEDGKSKVEFTAMGEIDLRTVKVKKITTEIGKRPVIAFGNSKGDYEMLEYTISNPTHKSLGVVINHDDEDREYKYSYDEVHQMCVDIGALEISMKNEFLTVF